MFDTIVAIATALNNQAISIIRISGPDSFNIVSKIFSKDLINEKSHTIHYGFIKDGDEIIDEVLVSIFKAPKTFTKEDVVEINCHGGSYVTRRILNLILTKGARIARAGEFTKRAYLNGRIDLTKAESINDIINAKNKIQAQSALKGLKGSILNIIEPLEKELLNLIGILEVNIDYPEYDDVEIMSEEKVRPKLNYFKNKMEEIVDKANRFRFIKNGIKVALVGKPNVGKSSLLNAILEKDKAIVSDIAGTTRDLIEDSVELKNITLNLVDTAGIRESDDKVEKIGIERSLKSIQEADLILFILDDTYDESDLALENIIKDKKYLKVYNKKDLIDYKEGIKISASNNDISELIDELERMYENDQLLIDEDVLNNERQISLMNKALIEIKEAIAALDMMIELDIISNNLYQAYNYLKEIKGISNREDLLDNLFKNFCLGK